MTRRSWFECLNGASTYSLIALSPSGRGTVRLTSLMGLLGGVSFDNSPRAFVSFEMSTFLGLLRKVLESGLSGAVTNTLGFDEAAGGAVVIEAAATCTLGNLGGGNGRL